MSLAKQQIVQELHKPARRNFTRRHTTIKGFSDLWQSDLADLQQHYRANRGYKYLLVIINCFSKYVWVAPLKNKSSKDVSKGMETIIKSVPSDQLPKYLQTDQGKEFYNAVFSKLMHNYGIKHYSTFSNKKAAIAERVIRTLKNKLFVEFGIRGNHKWFDIIEDVVWQYNHSKHRTIGMAPADVTSETQLIYPRNVPGCSDTKARFKEGDVVRISKYKGVFEKGYLHNWSTELFVVNAVQKTRPPTYLLVDQFGENISGCFYEQELQKTNHPDIFLVDRILKRKGKKSYVKWLGLSSRYNSWEPNTNLTL